ncbi:VWA domain-containing protein [Desulfallas sp. Bu1-1]|uniref:vWA domain-containing protein n=1 Tax=Desulfallas sp. Bu1-1 TaxID=2787620 RepID=UPI0018A02B84|nr:VWA domain-containing protein [Desulfallas sp. Bu1-1]MBF7084549.1 VWA domain-containing protein [Desulfallas sp. Bu1-1]
MQARVIELINFLREAGFSISTGETVDFFMALKLVGLERRDVETAALCTLAKDKQSYDQLPVLISSYLGFLKEKQKITPPCIDVRSVLNNPPRLSRREFLFLQNKIKNSIRDELAQNNSFPKTGPGVKAGGSGGLAGSGKPAGEAGRHGRFPGKPTAAGMDGQKPDHYTGAPRATNLRELDLSRADYDQLEEIRKIIVGMGRRLAVNKGYRKKPGPTGTVDMRKTVARAVSSGGVPLVLKKQRRIPSKPRLVVLCDLSGSVAPYSEFFLQVLVSLQQRFGSLRSFAFVDRVEEVTQLAKQSSDTFQISAQRILREAKISVTGFSNYGKVWEQFHQSFFDSLNRFITLIILGDARNNWQPDGLEYFRAISEQCRRVVWLNPMPRTKWRAGDCIIDTYAPFCSHVFECRNATQMMGVIREIL